MKPTSTNIYLVKTLGKGSLSIMARPSVSSEISKDRLAEFSAIAMAGKTHILSLLEHAEANELGLSLEAQWCTDHGLLFMQHPIKDLTVPESVEQFAAFTQDLHALIIEGAHLVVHCRAGIGRSGMTACAVLQHASIDASDAIKLTSSARGKPVPDTDEQVAFIKQLGLCIRR